LSIWKQGVIPGQSRRFALGSWLPYRKMASPAYVPAPKARLGLRYKRPMWYIMNVTLAGQDSENARISVSPNFRLMMILGLGTAAAPADGLGSFQYQLYDNARRNPFSRLPISHIVGAGNAQHPFILKNPYSFSGTTPVQAAIQNRALGTNNIYLVLYGVGD
jgi:hypothetical protein